MLSCTIGNRTFSIVPEANPTAEAFTSLLPMTLHMTELNGNEKYHTLLSPLPSRPERIGHVEAGDLMLFGDDCVVLFYKSFRTPYSYTRIGRLTDTTGLMEALGSGNPDVTFSAES